MLITILAMIKLTAAQTQIRLLRLIPGWKYASRSGPYHVGQGCSESMLKKQLILWGSAHKIQGTPATVQ
jgi:hypothetical protein